VNDLAEPLAAALILGALFAFVRGKRVAMWACLALLPLAKEPLVVVPLAVVGWELVRRRPRDAAVVATAVIPALVWWAYARIQLGAWFTSGDTALGKPLIGWYRAFLHQGTLGDITLAILLALFVLAALRAFRVRGPVELSYLALAALAVCLAPNATLAFTTAMRNTVFLFVLVPFVIAAPPLHLRPRL
jgi:hypothetical protein